MSHDTLPEGQDSVVDEARTRDGAPLKGDISRASQPDFPSRGVIEG